MVPLRLKIETNTREHFTVLGLTRRRFAVDSRWWTGSADITTFRLSELMATKLRALFQRKKGRDLFDLCVALDGGARPGAIARTFLAYAKRSGLRVTRAVFEENLARKLGLPGFTGDVPLLLPPGETFDAAAGASRLREEIIALLPGSPWKGPGGPTGGQERGMRRR